MRKYNIACLFILCLLTLLHTTGFSQKESCSSVFYREDRFLNLAMKAEELINKIKNTKRTKAEKSLKTNEEIVRLKSIIESQIHFIFEKNGHYSRRSLIRLSSNIRALEEIFNREINVLDSEPPSSVPVKKNPTLVDLIENPDIIQEGVAYRVDWPGNPQVVYVVFDQKIINDFFHPAKDLKNKRIIVEKSLKAVQKGYTKGKSNGIKLLNIPMQERKKKSGHNNKIFEIKTIGKFSGHIRWGGFIDGNVLYIVHHSSNTHGPRSSMLFLTALMDKLYEFHLSH